MSYARFGWDDSNVYVFANTDGKLECCGCWLRGNSRERIEFDTTAELHAHLDDHKAKGHCVPPSAYDQEHDLDETLAAVRSQETP